MLENKIKRLIEDLRVENAEAYRKIDKLAWKIQEDVEVESYVACAEKSQQIKDIAQKVQNNVVQIDQYERLI